MYIFLIIVCVFLFVRIIILIFFQKTKKLEFLNEEAVVLKSGEYDFVLFGVGKLSGLNAHNYYLINLETGDTIPSRPIKPQTTGIYRVHKYLRIVRFTIESSGSYRISIRGLESLSMYDSQLHLVNIFTSKKRDFQFTGIVKPFSQIYLIFHIILLGVILFIAIL